MSKKDLEFGKTLQKIGLKWANNRQKVNQFPNFHVTTTWIFSLFWWKIVVRLWSFRNWGVLWYKINFCRKGGNSFIFSTRNYRGKRACFWPPKITNRLLLFGLQVKKNSFSTRFSGQRKWAHLCNRWFLPQ